MTTANIATTKVVPTDTTLTPYYDDFDEDKNFHRVLFRPGYAVQAREVTQLQTILQNQIERFGNHIFQNGALVLGGQISLDTEAQHINLQSTYVGASVNAIAFKGNTITYASGNVAVRARVYDARESSGSDPATLIIKYMTGSEFGLDTAIKSTANVYANTALVTHNGAATLVSINDGIFYINGYFVKVPAQTIMVAKYTDQANAKIGLEYTEAIIDENDDSSLLDPAQESSNYQAPGATRLQINFDLVTRTLDTTDEESFVELMRVENGVIKRQIKQTLYSVIGDTMARRTFDESGNYTVRRFNLSINDHPTDNTKLQVVIDPGKAYLKGYEFESVAQQVIDLNKARDTVSVNNRATTISVGNYVNVFNVANTFDITAMEVVDLHTVLANAINTVTTTTYTSSKAGTARVRQARYFFSDSTADSNTDVISLSLFDMRFANLTSNASASSPNGVSLFDATGTSGKFNQLDGAYVGSTVRIVSGPGAGEKYNIVRYNGAGKYINIADRWTVAPTAASNVSIDMDFDSVYSIVKNTTYTAGAPAAASANVHVSSREAVNSYARLADTDRLALIFRMSDRYVKANSISGQTYQYMKYLSSPTAFTTGGVATIALAAGETFYSSNDTSGIASTTLSGIQAYRTSNGKRITLSNVAISGDQQTATIAVPGEGATIPYRAYVRVNINSGTESKPKTKLLRSANTTHKLAVGTSLTQNTAAGVTTMTVKTDADATGQVIISNPTNSSAEWMSLFMVDVKSIDAIYDLDGAAIPADGSVLSGYTNVLSDYAFSTGQRDTMYDFASISLKPSRGPKKGPLIVCFKWYDHTSGASDGSGYFNIDSYVSPETYAGIPTYVSRDGTEYPLGECIDFRPSRTNKTSTAPNFGIDEVRIPMGDTSFTHSYQYYLARKSNVILTRDLENPFKIVDGVSNKIPLDPPLSDDTMLLYKLHLYPYTSYRQNVNVQFVENKRYTMRDIGKLETRIGNLEYYQLLTLLEKQADSMKILDASGLERTKYGILTDNFYTQSYGDVNDPDYFVSIDTTEGGLYPATNVAASELYLSANTNTIQSGQLVTLSYTETPAIVQNNATKWAQVQPYMVAQWIGTIVMDPPDDNWVETRIAPDVVINTGVNDAIKADAIPNNSLATKRNQPARHFGLPTRFR